MNTDVAPPKTVYRLFVGEVALFLLALVVMVTVISNIATTINQELFVIDGQARGVNHDTTTLPGLVASITASLETINNEASPIHNQLTQINNGLGHANNGLNTAEVNLNGTEGSLSHIEGTLQGADSGAATIAANLVTANGQAGTIDSQASAAINLLTPVKADTGNISTQAAQINGHLASVSGSGLVGLLHGLGL